MKRIISAAFMAVLAVLLSALVFAPVSYAADADSSVSDTLVSQASSGSQNVSAAGNVQKKDAFLMTTRSMNL